MPRRLTLSLDHLAQQFEKPRPRGGAVLRRVGPFTVWEAPRSTEIQSGRWLTVLAFDRTFLVVVDDFHDSQSRTFCLSLRSEQALRPLSRNIFSISSHVPLVLNLLGDYAQEAERHCLTLTQRLAHGRFVLALSRDEQALVRGLNGWAVESRSAGRVVQLLHSNRSARLRSLGPIQTDARFAAAEWSAAEGVQSALFGVNLALLGVRQLRWQQNGQLTSPSAIDLTIVEERVPT